MQLEKLYLQLPGTIRNHQYLMSQVASGVDSIASACVQVERSLYAVRSELHAATCSGWQTIEWKMLQRLFQREFKLPVSFDYQKYLKLKLMDAMGHQLHVSVFAFGLLGTGQVVLYPQRCSVSLQCFLRCF